MYTDIGNQKKKIIFLPNSNRFFSIKYFRFKTKSRKKEGQAVIFSVGKAPRHKAVERGDDSGRVIILR